MCKMYFVIGTDMRGNIDKLILLSSHGITFHITGSFWGEYIGHSFLPVSRHTVQINGETRGLFYKHGLTLILVWISNYINYKVWDEITYPFQNEV